MLSQIADRSRTSGELVNSSDEISSPYSDCAADRVGRGETFLMAQEALKAHALLVLILVQACDVFATGQPGDKTSYGAGDGGHNSDPRIGCVDEHVVHIGLFFLLLCHALHAEHAFIGSSLHQVCLRTMQLVAHPVGKTTSPILSSGGSSRELPFPIRWKQWFSGA